MVTAHLVPPDLAASYEVHEWRNAAGVLSTSCPEQWQELLVGLREFRLMRSEVLAPGKNRSKIVDRFERPFKKAGWIKKQFSTAIRVDDVEVPSPTHEVDCFKARVALEMEWNNKDAFYDRDLNNFRLLFDLRIIDVGVIVTRCDHLQDIFNDLGKGTSYGASTTHLGKLLPKAHGGGAGGCPVLVFGITRKLYVEDEIPSLEEIAAAQPEPGEEPGE